MWREYLKLRESLILRKEGSENWFSFYTSLGFFSQYQTLSESESKLEITNHYFEEWGKSFDPVDYFTNLTVLAMDKNRVWWRDLECDVCEMNQSYVHALHEWSKISRGIFLPKDIKETWESEVGPITLEFSLDNSRYRLGPNYDNDWLDLKIIVEINKILMASGKHWLWHKKKSQYRFEIIQTYDQTSFITVLSPDEKLKMKYRGFIFIEQ